MSQIASHFSSNELFNYGVELPYNDYSIEELAKNLLILRNDLISKPDFVDGSDLPILYNANLSKAGDEVFEQNVERSNGDCKYRKKVHAALFSCNSYINSLIKERKIFDKFPFFVDVMEATEVKIETFQSTSNLKEAFIIFLKKGWKFFYVIESFYLFVTVDSETENSDEAGVLKALKDALECFGLLVNVDVGNPEYAKQVLDALKNVKKSIRSLYTYLWVYSIMNE